MFVFEDSQRVLVQAGELVMVLSMMLVLVSMSVSVSVLLKVETKVGHPS